MTLIIPVLVHSFVNNLEANAEPSETRYICRKLKWVNCSLAIAIGLICILQELVRRLIFEYEHKMKACQQTYQQQEQEANGNNHANMGACSEHTGHCDA
jgi:flagellar biosynthesis/type III secretory pathway M-ring protein FliF/YscJ